mmetsp:Transcript_25525/g.29447  ORF Transcript_25525/g.29447 Transcript_25525/m.29447 type:complete len:93 (+) Transcript_25525:127-405(+)
MMGSKTIPSADVCKRNANEVSNFGFQLKLQNLHLYPRSNSNYWPNLTLIFCVTPYQVLRSNNISDQRLSQECVKQIHHPKCHHLRIRIKNTK